MINVSYRAKAYAFFGALALTLAANLGGLVLLALSRRGLAVSIIELSPLIVIAILPVFASELVHKQAKLIIQPAE